MRFFDFWYSVRGVRKLIAYGLCTAGMIGVYFLVRYAIFGISADFGHGFFVGGATIVLLFWASDKVSRKSASNAARLGDGDL